MFKPTSSVARCHHGGPPSEAPNDNTYPCNNPILLSLFLSLSFLKLSYKTFFCLNPPRLWPGDIYRPSVTIGAPIRAPKRQYIPLQQPHFAQPLSKLTRQVPIMVITASMKTFHSLMSFFMTLYKYFNN